MCAMARVREIHAFALGKRLEVSCTALDDESSPIMQLNHAAMQAQFLSTALIVLPFLLMMSLIMCDDELPVSSVTAIV